MQEKYKDKGVVLVALTDESMQTADRVIKSAKANYLVGVESARTRGAYGSRSFPTIFIIDPDGKVAFWGHSARDAEAVIDKLLKEKPPKIAKSVATRNAEKRIAEADALLKDNKYVEALREFQDIAKVFEGSPVAKLASGRIDSLRSNPNLAEMIKQSEARAKKDTHCTKLLHLARALVNAGHGGQASKYYDQVAKDCADTEYAPLAAAERASLSAATPEQTNDKQQ